MNNKLIVTGLFALILLNLGTVKAQVEVLPPSEYSRSEFLVNKKTKVSGFISPMTELSNFDNDLAFGSGAGAALLFNQRFFIGAYGLGSTSTDFSYFETNTGSRFPVRPSLGHGGFWVGSIIGHKHLIHAVVSSTLGWGGMYVTDNDFEDIISRDISFIATPQISAELNVAKWFKINAGIGYRFAPGISNSYYAANSIDGLTYNMGVSIGWFNQKVK